MKKVIIYTFVSILALPLSAQFKAKMHFTGMGQDHVFTVYSSDAGYRYEFNEHGQAGVIIVKQGSEDVIILMPQQKMAMRSSAGDKMSMGNDPVASYKYFLDQGILKVEGEETINGIKCTRSGLWNKENADQKMYTVWTSADYSMPVKIINHIDVSGEAAMELREIEPWTPNPGYLEVPDGYQVMDMPVGMPQR